MSALPDTSVVLPLMMLFPSVSAVALLLMPTPLSVKLEFEIRAVPLETRKPTALLRTTEDSIVMLPCEKRP